MKRMVNRTALKLRSLVIIFKSTETMKKQATLWWFECFCPPRIHTLKPNAQCVGIRRWDAFGKWLGYDSGDFMDGSSAFVERFCRSP